MVGGQLGKDESGGETAGDAAAARGPPWQGKVLTSRCRPSGNSTECCCNMLCVVGSRFTPWLCRPALPIRRGPTAPSGCLSPLPQVLVSDPKELEKIRERELDITRERIQKIIDAGGCSSSWAPGMAARSMLLVGWCSSRATQPLMPCC